MVKSIFFPEDYKFIFTTIFGDTPRIRIIEFFIVTTIKSDNPPWTFMAQISRLLGLPKSSVKNVVDNMLNDGFLIENKIETHQKNPQRNIRINNENRTISHLKNFYNELKHVFS
jgi:DNA-binding MarR family transcriptional regulator